MLGKSVGEILALQAWEFEQWIAYYRIKQEEESKAIKRSRQKAQARRGK